MIITFLGREPNLTDRVPIWNELLKIHEDPILGVGYESFWLGERLIHMWQASGGAIIQSHNGYLDLYLNIGAVGLVLLIISIITGSIKAIKHLNYEYNNAILRIIFIVIVVIYNWTEATFQPLNNMFVLLLFSIFQVSRQKQIIKKQTIPNKLL
jgi:O-antigen ligase